MIVLENKSVLVTGGAGFVGSNLVRRLIRDGAKVTVLDDLFTGTLANLPPSGFDFIEGSVCDAALIDKVVPEHAVVFHMAARNIIVSTKNPREDFQSNIGGTLNVLMAARAAKVKRLFALTTRTLHWFLAQGFRAVEVGTLPGERRALYNWKRGSKVFAKKL